MSEQFLYDFSGALIVVLIIYTCVDLAITLARAFVMEVYKSDDFRPTVINIFFAIGNAIIIFVMHSLREFAFSN